MVRRVELGDDETYGNGTLVEQTEVAWADDEITVTIVKGVLAVGSLFLFVTNADEQTSDGFPVTLEEPPPDPGPDVGSVSGLVGGSVNVRLERIYASVSGHEATSGARDIHFLMRRIGQERGINLTSGLRSFETNLAILYRDLSGSSWQGAKSSEMILRAIEDSL